MAIALTAWLTAAAPIARSMTFLLSYTAWLIAAATDADEDEADTLNSMSLSICASIYVLLLIQRIPEW
jgi:hypothetical protein